MPPPEAPLFAAFPEHADLAGKEGRERLTVHHALSMTMGTDWDETSLPYTDPNNSEIAMDLAPDRYRYVLARRVIRVRALDVHRQSQYPGRLPVQHPQHGTAQPVVGATPPEVCTRCR